MSPAKKALRLVVFILIGLLVVNMILFALKIISALLFWVIIGVVGYFTYKNLPALKKWVDKNI